MKNNKIYYKYIFIVLLYRNMTDVLDLIASIQEKVSNFHVILVNSFYDDNTENEAKKIVEHNKCCSFFSVENHGYGVGNNAGIQYAYEYFNFDFIIISNPDIVIRKFDESVLLDSSVKAIYAPKIISCDYKRQNPNWAFHSDILEYFQYLACKKNNFLLDYSVIAILKLLRVLYGWLADCFNYQRIRVGNAHGSFVIISHAALQELVPLYDENMFLFYEEVYLGHRAFCADVPTYYIKNVVINHKEDGSMRIANVNTRKEAHKSVIYYYEHKNKL